jgi:hypothetical protein
MPQSNFQRLIFSLITVIITVPCFVFYCGSIQAGGFSVEVIRDNWKDIFIEIIFAFISAAFIVNPIATKLALRAVNPTEHQPIMIQTAIVCTTVCLMCPLMSFWATILYDGIINVGMHGASLSNFFINFIPYWLQKVVVNFPFAFFTQLFFIQPLVRTIFRTLFRKKIA